MSKMRVEKFPFGMVGDREVFAFRVDNGNGFVMTVIEYGATLLSLKHTAESGRHEELTLHYATLPEILAKSPYYGATCGRFANRIAKGTFILDGKRHNLATNNDTNHLHGGLRGFDKVVWDGEAIEVEERDGGARAGVKLTYQSKHGEEEYPGNLNVTARYLLTSDNELFIYYDAETDRPTPVNLTNHAYWNLTGGFKDDVGGHMLQLYCPRYLPVDETQIPTGELRRVDGTDFDFVRPRSVGDRMLKVACGGVHGFDHCFVVAGALDDEESKHIDAECSASPELSLPAAPGYTLRPIAKLTEPTSGRVMEVFSTQPGVQLYTGNWVTGGAPHVQHNALCLETQHFPDAVNHEEFPSCILRPGERYSHCTVHRFSQERE